MTLTGVVWPNHIHLHSGAFGGIVLGVTATRQEPQVLYAVVFGRGVYKSTSGGRTWTDISRWVLNPTPLGSTPPGGSGPPSPVTGDSTLEGR